MADEIILGTHTKLNKRVVNGQIISKIWQVTVRSKVGKKPFRRSTGKANKKEAEQVAFKLAIEFWEKEAGGLPTTSHRFNKVADLFITQMETDLKNGVGKQQYKESIRILRKSMIPYFATNLIGAIDIDDLRKYVEWRREQRGGIEISRSYEKNENAAFNGLMRFAYERKWVSNKLTLPKVKTEDPTDRTRFTDSEWSAIRRELSKLSKMPSKNKTTIEIREFLYDYSVFLRNCGMRCGKESLLIKWAQFEFVPVDQLPKQHRQAVLDSNQAEVLVLHLKQGETKTGKKRTVIFFNEHQAVSNLLIRLASKHEDTKCLVTSMPSSTAQEKNDLLRKLFNCDEYAFRFASEGQVSQLTDKEQEVRIVKRTQQISKAFTKLLDSLGLRKTKDGSKHTLYSVRHLYISKMLELGCPIAIVAKQVGNSVAIVEKFYNSANTLSNTPVLSGIIAAKDFEKNSSVVDIGGQYAQMSVADISKAIAELSIALQLKAS